MRCLKCNKSYSIPIELCPICSEPHEMLRGILDHWGESIIGTKRLLGIVLDLMPNMDVSYRRIFKRIVDDGVDIQLLEYTKDENGGELKIKNLISTFKKNNGYDESADYVLNSLLYAFEYIDEEKLNSKWKSILVEEKRKKQIEKEDKSIPIVKEDKSIPIVKEGKPLNEVIHNIKHKRVESKTINDASKRLINQNLKDYEFGELFIRYFDVIFIISGLILGLIWAWFYLITFMGVLGIIARTILIIKDYNDNYNEAFYKYIINSKLGSSVITIGGLLLLIGISSVFFLVIAFIFLIGGIFVSDSEMGFEKLINKLKENN